MRDKAHQQGWMFVLLPLVRIQLRCRRDAVELIEQIDVNKMIFDIGRRAVQVVKGILRKRRSNAVHTLLEDVIRRGIFRILVIIMDTENRKTGGRSTRVKRTPSSANSSNHYPFSDLQVTPPSSTHT